MNLINQERQYEPIRIDESYNELTGQWDSSLRDDYFNESPAEQQLQLNIKPKRTMKASPVTYHSLSNKGSEIVTFKTRGSRVFITNQAGTIERTRPTARKIYKQLVRCFALTESKIHLKY